jgi:hypothetical protein
VRCPVNLTVYHILTCGRLWAMCQNIYLERGHKSSVYCRDYLLRKRNLSSTASHYQCLEEIQIFILSKCSDFCTVAKDSYYLFAVSDLKEYQTSNKSKSQIEFRIVRYARECKIRNSKFEI